MDILISYDNQELSLSLAGGENAALYAVPTAIQRRRPVPGAMGNRRAGTPAACGTWTPLLRLCLADGEDGADSLVEDFKADGVSYAQN